jgi:DNA-binding GntR family transcriptional regulator
LNYLLLKLPETDGKVAATSGEPRETPSENIGPPANHGATRQERIMALERGPNDVLVRPPLHEQLTERLRELIVHNELAPGERVDEKQLCERFGVSRTPLREALKVLAAEGLIELIPNRSPRVAPITRENVGELFDVMAWLERYAGELAAARVEDKDIQRLRKHLAQMERLHDRKDRFEYFRMNGQFHRVLVELSGNSVLLATYSTLASQIQRARYVAIHSQTHWDRGIKEHRNILEALEAKDGERLGRLLLEHSRETGQRVKELLSSGADTKEVRPSE